MSEHRPASAAGGIRGEPARAAADRLADSFGFDEVDPGEKAGGSATCSTGSPPATT